MCLHACSCMCACICVCVCELVQNNFTLISMLDYMNKIFFPLLS